MQTKVPDRIASLKSRARLIVAGSAWLRWISFVIAIICILMSVAIVVLALTNMPGASYYRAGLYALTGVVSLCSISAWSDGEPLDLKLGIAFSIVAFLVNAYAAGWETARTIQCSNVAPVTLIDQTICLGEASKNVNVYFAWAFVVFSLLQLIVVFFWLGRVGAATAAKRAAQLLSEQAKNADQGTPTSPAFAANKSAAVLAEKAAKITDANMGSAWLVLTHKTLGVIGVIVFLAVTVMNMIFIDEVSFYRSPLLIVAAHATGASLGVFGSVKSYWPWIITVFGLLGGAAALVAVIWETQRQSRCGAPVGVYEQQICTVEGWRAFIVPVESYVVLLLMVLTVVFGIWSAATARRIKVARI